MKASIIAAGSEMLGPTRVDTNSLKITSILEDFAVPLVHKAIGADVLELLTDELRFAAAHSDIIITTGGLGPTEDDLTRDALKEAFELETEVDQSIIAQLEARFAARG